MGTFKINGELELNSYLTAATTLYISSADNTSIIFKHGSTEYIRINPSGCLNIGSTQTASTYKLYVAGKSWLSDTLYFNSTASYINASNYTGNAATATKLATARTISLTGSVTGSGSFDGSGNLSITTTTNHNHDSTYVNINGDTMTGRLSTPGLTISSTSANEHIKFSRASGNYFTCPTGGSFCFTPNGKTVSFANSDLLIEDGVVYPGTDSYTALGTSTKGWKGGFFSGGNVTITNGTLIFKNTTATPAKGTILNCISGQYQNAAGNYYTIGLVDLVASAEASTTVSSGYARFGSHNGASFFTAGESGRTMPKALADAGTLTAEAAYITADSSIIMYAGCANDAASYTKAMTVTSSKITSHVPLYGAVWNDYAEYRQQLEDIEPGYCVVSNNKGKVSKTFEKLQACDGIVSDTFGFAIGETSECKTPLAVAGRVLAYCEGDRNDYSAGDTVCAGPNGKVVKMTREEIQEWPDRIVGIVSEIPEYETWGSGNIAVNGRIWIKVK